MILSWWYYSVVFCSPLKSKLQHPISQLVSLRESFTLDARKTAAIWSEWFINSAFDLILSASSMLCKAQLVGFSTDYMIILLQIYKKKWIMKRLYVFFIRKNLDLSIFYKQFVSLQPTKRVFSRRVVIP